MGFGLFTDLPRLRDYDYALAHYKSIVPLRGRSVDVRPICNTSTGRRKTHMIIHKTTYDGIPAIACQLYSTNVVTYVSDGRVVIDNDYPSSSTNSFASDLITVGAMHMANGLTWFTCAGKSWWVPAGDKLELNRTNNSAVLAPVKPHQPYQCEVIRKKANECYRKYAAFTAHCVSIAKLLGDSVPEEYTRRYLPLSGMENLTQSDMQEWGVAIRYFISASLTNAWVREPSGYVRKVTLCPQRLARNIREAVKDEHAAQIFTQTPAPLGVLISNPNRKYRR